MVGEDRDAEEDHQNFFPTGGAVGLYAEQQSSDEDECEADPISGSSLSFVVEGHHDLLVAKPQGAFTNHIRKAWRELITARIKAMSLEGLPSQLRAGEWLSYLETEGAGVRIKRGTGLVRTLDSHWDYSEMIQDEVRRNLRVYPLQICKVGEVNEGEWFE